MAKSRPTSPSEIATSVQPHRPKVVISAAFDDRVLADLAAIAEVVVIPPGDNGLDDGTSLIDAQLAEANVLVVESATVDAAVLEAAPNLEMVIACRSNPSSVDVDACEGRGVRVETTPARNADVTADLAFGLLLSCVRQIPPAERWLRAGNWTLKNRFEAYRRFRGMALNGRTLGLVGLGAVGGRMARRASAFGMQVIASDPDPAADATLGFVERCSLNDVFRRADIVSIHAPLVPATVGLIGSAELALLRPGAYLINSARAAIVDESALVGALASGHLAGAGLDVFHEEPLPPTSELLDFDNVVLTPHIGGASADVIANHSFAALTAVARLIAARSESS